MIGFMMFYYFENFLRFYPSRSEHVESTNEGDSNLPIGHCHTPNGTKNSQKDREENVSSNLIRFLGLT